MRILDCLSFSMLNIKSHMVRTAITIVMQTLLTVIIIAVMLSVITGYGNARNEITKYFELNGTKISYHAAESYENRLSKDEYDSVYAVIANSGFEYNLNAVKYWAVIDELGCHVEITISDIAYEGDGIYIAKGLYDYINSFQTTQIGDIINTNILLGNEEFRINARILGVMEDNSGNAIALNYSQAYNIGIPVLYGMYYDINPSKIEYADLALRVSTMEKELNKIATHANNNYSIQIRTDIAKINLGFGILLPVALIICSVLLIVMLGGVINSLLLTSSENEKFFGLCIAQGLHSRILYAIIIIESVFTTVLSAIVSAIICLGLKGVIDAVSSRLWGAFLGESLSVASSATFPIWLPFALLAVSLAMCAIAALPTIKKMRNADVVKMLKGDR